MIRAFLVLLALSLCPTLAEAKIKRSELIGAWAYVSSYIEFPDGRRVEQFGDKPEGILILLPNGIYSHIIMENNLPKYKSGLIKEATNEEAQRVAAGSLSHYGTFRVDEANDTFVAHIYKSDFPNFDNQDQLREVTKLTRNELHYINKLSTAGEGAYVHAVLRRVWAPKSGKGYSPLLSRD